MHKNNIKFNFLQQKIVRDGLAHTKRSKPFNFLNGHIFYFGNFPISVTKNTTVVTNFKYNENINKQLTDFLKTYKLAKLTAAAPAPNGIFRLPMPNRQIGFADCSHREQSNGLRLPRSSKTYKDFNNLSIESKKTEKIQRSLDLVNTPAIKLQNQREGNQSANSYGTIDYSIFPVNSYKITYNTLKGLMKYRKTKSIVETSQFTRVMLTKTGPIIASAYQSLPTAAMGGDFPAAQPKNQQNRSYGFLQSILVKYLETTPNAIIRSEAYSLLCAYANNGKKSNYNKNTYGVTGTSLPLTLDTGGAKPIRIGGPENIDGLAQKPSTFFHPSLAWSSKNLLLLSEGAMTGRRVSAHLPIRNRQSKDRNKQHFLFTKINNKTFLAYWLIPVAGLALLTPNIYGWANPIHYNLDVYCANILQQLPPGSAMPIAPFGSRSVLPIAVELGRTMDRVYPLPPGAIVDPTIAMGKVHETHFVGYARRIPYDLQNSTSVSDRLVNRIDQSLYSIYNYIKPLNNLYTLINAQTFFCKNIFTKSSNTKSIRLPLQPLQKAKSLSDVNQKQFNSQQLQVSHSWSELPISGINYKSSINLSVHNTDKFKGLPTQRYGYALPIAAEQGRQSTLPTSLVKNYLNLKNTTLFSRNNNTSIARLNKDIASHYSLSGLHPHTLPKSVSGTRFKHKKFLLSDGQGWASPTHDRLSQAPFDHISRYPWTTEVANKICNQSINPLYSTTLLNNNLNFITTKNSLKLLHFKIISLNPSVNFSTQSSMPEASSLTSGSKYLNQTKRFLLSKNTMATQASSSNFKSFEQFKPFRSYHYLSNTKIDAQAHHEALNLVNLNIKSCTNDITPLCNIFTNLTRLRPSLYVYAHKEKARVTTNYKILFKLWSQPNTRMFVTDASVARISNNGRALNNIQPTTNVPIFNSNKNNLLLNYFIYTYGVNGLTHVTDVLRPLLTDQGLDHRHGLSYMPLRTGAINPLVHSVRSLGTRSKNQEFLSSGPLQLKINLIKTTTPGWTNLSNGHGYSALPVLAHTQKMQTSHSHQYGLKTKHKANGLNLYFKFINKKLNNFIFLKNLNDFNTNVSNVHGQSSKQPLSDTCPAKELVLKQRSKYIYRSTSILLKHQKMFKCKSQEVSVMLPEGAIGTAHRLHIQKKRKAKKQRLETRRQKKRMRFFPRPLWLRYRMFLNFVNQRNLKNNLLSIPTYAHIVTDKVRYGPTEWANPLRSQIQWRTLDSYRFGSKYIDPVRTYKYKSKFTSNAITRFTIKPFQTPFRFSYLVLRSSSIVNQVNVIRRLTWDVWQARKTKALSQKLLSDLRKAKFIITGSVGHGPNLSDNTQSAAVGITLPSMGARGVAHSGSYGQSLSQSKKFLRDIKIKANYVNFKNQKTNNPPPLSDKDKDKDTIFRDIWIWAYNNISPNKYNQILWWLLPNNTSTLTFSKKEGDLYNNICQFKLSTDRSKNHQTQISKQTFTRTLTRIHWALNKTNYSSFIDYNKRYNLWGTQKLRNQSKNNKTKNLEKQFITNWEKFFLNKKLNAFYKKIHSKLNQKTQKLNYLTSYTGSTISHSMPPASNIARSQHLVPENYSNTSAKSIGMGIAHTHIPVSGSRTVIADKALYKGANNSQFFFERSKNIKIFNTAWWSDLNIKPLLTDLTINKTMDFKIANYIGVSEISNSNPQRPLQTTSSLLISSTVLLHFCALISLVSISQVRCFVKFHVILLYKLSNIYNTLLKKISRASALLPLPPGAMGRAHPPAAIGIADLVASNGQSPSFTHLQREKPKGLVTDALLPAAAVYKNQIPSFARNLQTQKKLLTYFCFNLLKKEFTYSAHFGGNRRSNLDSKTHMFGLLQLNKMQQSSMPPASSMKSPTKNIVPTAGMTSKARNLRSKLNIISLKAAFLKRGIIRWSYPSAPEGGNRRSSRKLAPENVGKPKNSLELYYKYNSTKLNMKKTRNFLFKSSKNLVFKVVFNFIDLFQSSVRSISNFFEKPAEFTTTWIAYGFLVEWSSDLITIIPENIDIYIWNVFSKLMRITPLWHAKTLVFNNGIFMPALLTVSYLVHRRIFYLFDTFFETISQPDTDLLRRQQKGTLFWDLWADFIVTAADYYNVNVAALSTIKAEQNILIEKISNDTNDFGNMAHNATATVGSALLSLKGRDRFKPSTNGYITEWAKPMGWASNSGPINRWSVNQYITYQSWHSHNGSNNSNGDLFIDYHPPKSFAHIPTIKYNSALQQPIGTLVCQIYSGLFNKQISKNLLLINRKTTAAYGSLDHRDGLSTTNYNILLIQALAGETELKIITDNAQRYALVNRGFAIGIKLLREVFDAIALNTPCIFLLEDIHAIGERRPMLISDYGSGMSDDHGTFKEDFFGGQRDEVHEKNQVIYQLTRHAITHYKKPFKGDYSLAIPTNLYVNDLFLKKPTQSTSNLSLIEKHNLTIKNKIKVKDSKLLNGTGAMESTQTNKTSSDLTSFLQIPQALSKIAPPSTSPFTVLLLKEEKKLKPNKIVEELPWNGLPGEQLLTKPRASYSVRAKVAMLAELSLSNLSAKLDMITDLLVIIDSVRGNKGFVVFATTNVPHVLDPALRRPGRLDETICMPNNTSDITSRVSYEIIKAVKPLTNNPLTDIFDRPLGWSSGNIISKNINFSSSYVPVLTVNLKDYSVVLGSLKEEGQFYLRKNFENLNLNYALISHSSLLSGNQLPPALPTGWALPISAEGSTVLDCPRRGQIALEGSRAMGPAHQKIVRDKDRYKTLRSNQIGSAIAPEGGRYNYKKNNYKARAYYEVGKVMLNYYLNTHNFGHSLWHSTNNNTLMSLKSINFLSLYGSKNKLILQLMLLFGGKISQLLSSKKNNFNYNHKTKTNKYNIGVSNLSQLFELDTYEVNDKDLSIQNTDSSSMPEASSMISKGRKSVVPIAAESSRQSFLQYNKNFQIATSIMLAFIHKRYLYRKNLIVPKLLSFIDGNVLDEPPSPPFSSLLIPAKRFENFKRVFRDSLVGDKMGQRKSQISLSEKLQTHMQLRSIKLLKNQGAKVKNSNISPHQSNFVIKDFPTHLLVQTTTNINWYYQNRILKRHGLYLTNQWWNGQLSEHNAETIFLSDIDWRSSFIKNNQINVVKSKKLFNGTVNRIHKYGRNDSLDIVLDFPDTDQYYNPRRRRWLLNKGYWSFWFNFDKLYSEEILSTWILESIIQTYTYLHNNTEVLDFITSKYITLGYVTQGQSALQLKAADNVRYQPNIDISSRACIKEIILTNCFKRF